MIELGTFGYKIIFKINKNIFGMLLLKKGNSIHNK